MVIFQLMYTMKAPVATFLDSSILCVAGYGGRRLNTSSTICLRMRPRDNQISHSLTSTDYWQRLVEEGMVEQNEEGPVVHT